VAGSLDDGSEEDTPWTSVSCPHGPLASQGSDLEDAVLGDGRMGEERGGLHDRPLLARLEVSVPPWRPAAAIQLYLTQRLLAYHAPPPSVTTPAATTAATIARKPISWPDKCPAGSGVLPISGSSAMPPTGGDDHSMTSWGACAPDSRLAWLMAVVLVPVSAMLNVPLPVIRDVISTVVQSPAEKGPDDPTTVGEMAGALL